MVAQLPNHAGGMVGASAGVAKDPSQSTKLSKRIGWLNNHGGLSLPIKYSEVKHLMDAMGEVSALALLKDLETKGAAVQDPTAFLKAAAQRACGASALGQAAGVWGSSASRADAAYGAAAQGYPVQAYEAPAYHAQVQAYQQPQATQAYGGVAAMAPQSASRGDAEARLKRRVGWLNQNVGFSAQLEYNKASPLLLAAGDTAAMDILKQLEAGAAEIRDPTGWVCAAAKRLLAGIGSSSPPAISGGCGPARGVVNTIGYALPAQGNDDIVSKLNKRIRWLNANASLKVPINFDKVVHLLSPLGVHPAMELLKDVEVKGGAINDPTAYVASAARRAQGQGASSPMQTPRTSSVPPMPLPFGFAVAPVDHDREERDTKIRRRIGWLNSNGALKGTLTYDKVTGYLMRLDISEAMNILKQLEENSGSIPDPNEWVVATAQAAPKAAQSQGAPGGSTADVDEKLRKRIGWLNRNGGLSGELRYDQVAPALRAFGPQRAMEILKELEANAASAGDPTGYVLQLAASSPRPEQGAGTGMPGGPEEKLRTRIRWLNEHVQLAMPLEYDDLAPSLLAIEVHQAMIVLKGLEENATTVLDPYAYVVEAVQHTLAEGSAA